MKKKSSLRQSLKISQKGHPAAGKSRALQLYREGKLAEAAQQSAEELKIDPGAPAALYVQGLLAWHCGDVLQALDFLVQVVKAKPGFAEAYLAIACINKGLGDFPEAAAAFQKTLSLGMKTAAIYNDLGIVLSELGELEPAIAQYQKALALEANYAQGYYNLGIVMQRLGRLAEAVDCYRKVLKIDPDFYLALDNLGALYDDLGELAEALACSQLSLGINAHNPIAYNNLANVQKKTGHLREALDNCLNALKLDSNYAMAYRNLATIQQDFGQVNEALSSYRQSVACRPDPVTHSNLLYALNYPDNVSQEEILADSLRWDEAHGLSAAPQSPGYANSLVADRRLRVGYVSPDFKDHSVAYFIEPVLRSHSREKLEIYCYANVGRPDLVTARLMTCADHWRDISRQSDQTVADLIRQDGIDILVDLAGHTAGNRLPVFARRPAPVQVTWLGYPNTTGLQAMAYRLTDVVADPRGQADALHVETLLRLEPGFLCYQPEAAAPPVGPLPARQQGYITFGSFNNLAKITPAVVSLWAAILRAVPHSRIVLKDRVLANEETSSHFKQMFALHGVVAERLDLLDMVPGKADHLGLYGKIDIALDTFPYNGTTTTFEALWMGVPVITLVGSRHSGRVGASIMQQAGLTKFVGDSLEQYRELALLLAKDLDRLESLRSSLRACLQNSPLLDQGRFTASLEGVFRQIWCQWCETSVLGQAPKN
ncbi:MAG: tetratricopeptide repeat protein [Desulfobulbaceae bacterium]|nr:tetratricopeptide repeat protein [Desulfobulbaceae bacterium]